MSHPLLLLRSGAKVREVDLTNITGGVVHTKLWVVDKKHMYVGSANMDWRSLTQVFLKISSVGRSEYKIRKQAAQKPRKSSSVFTSQPERFGFDPRVDQECISVWSWHVLTVWGFSRLGQLATLNCL